MSPAKKHIPYGLWDSPIKPTRLAQGVSFPALEWDSGGSLLWLEGRPERSAIVVQPPDGQAPRDLNPDYSARGRVGYGGGEFTVKDGQVFFVAADSGRIFRQDLSQGLPDPITPGFGGAASPAASPDGRWLIFVHTYEGQDSLVIVDCQGMYWPQKIAQGHDFYMQPAWHPAGKQIAWVAWDHPHMPWDSASLYLGELQQDAGTLPYLLNEKVIAGGDEISVFQPQFSPDGRWLAYVSDQTGWWQIYLYDLENGSHRQLTGVQAEHALPAWVQGMRTYDFSADGKRLFFLRDQGGVTSLWELDLDTGQEQRIPLDESYASLDQIRAAPSSEAVALVASGPNQPPRLITVSRSGEVFVRRRSTSEDLPRSTYSTPRSLEWAGKDGETVYGHFYPPHHARIEGIGLPPLVALVHSGPTSHRRAAFDLQVQFFTSRGYACLLVNYRGSSGYGRAYRSRLHGSWGVYDVEDVISGVKYVAGQGWVDAERQVIMGSSAGGFTVLKALEDYPGFFKAGIALYAVSNHLALVGNTHKFELHYSDSLLGPFPQAAAVYRERSPIFFASRIRDPIALFQGENDAVVPESQSDEMVASLKSRGVPHLYNVYSGEGHGFRKQETIEHVYTTIEQFLRQYVILA